MSDVALAGLRSRLAPVVRRLLLAVSRAQFALRRPQPARINLAAGAQRVPGYFTIDIDGDVDLRLDLSHSDLPFENASIEAVVCISAINYFSASRAERIVAETFRVLRPGGVARYGVQDLRKLVASYLNRDLAFLEQKNPDGTCRFVGATPADKLAAWFYGYPTSGGRCRYVYDFESLARRFTQTGFRLVEERPYRSSRLADIALIDNRPDQMFFLEAVK